MEEEGYVSPARRESRLVMVQLEPKTAKLTRKKQLRSKVKAKGSPKPGIQETFQA